MRSQPQRSRFYEAARKVSRREQGDGNSVTLDIL
jgi:hypothetical protein